MTNPVSDAMIASIRDKWTEWKAGEISADDALNSIFDLAMKAAEQPYEILDTIDPAWADAGSDDYCGIVQMSEEDTRVSSADEVERGRLVARLRLKAKQVSDISRQMAESKSLRQAGHEPPRKDLYMWSRPEETDEWKAAEIIAALSAIKGQQSTVDEVERLIERLEREDVMQVDHKPFVEIWETDFREILATLKAIRNGDEGMREVLQGLVDAVTPEANEKGAGGYLLARLSDAREYLDANR